jgi:hypothetical protein
MLTSILVLAGVSSFFLLILSLLHVEQKRGNRIFLRRVRNWFDRLLQAIVQVWGTVRLVVGRFVLQLGFRYVVHVFLRSLLLGIANLYDGLMAYFEYNRKRTKSIRKAKQVWGESGRTHLTELREHQDNSALSDGEKKARKQAAIEGR